MLRLLAGRLVEDVEILFAAEWWFENSTAAATICFDSILYGWDLFN